MNLFGFFLFILISINVFSQVFDQEILLFNDILPNASQSHWVNSRGKYTNFNQSSEMILRKLKDTKEDILFLERWSGASINDRLAIISSSEYLNLEKRMDDLKLRYLTEAHLNTSYKFQEFEQSLVEVYQIFLRQLKRGRSAFSSDFIQKLKDEDLDARLDRTSIFRISNMRDPEKPNRLVLPSSSKFSSFWGIFDGSRSGNSERIGSLPFEKKNPDIKLIEREKNQKVLEIKRLASPEVPLDLITRILAEHFVQMGMWDYQIIVHTDAVGARKFRAYSFIDQTKLKDSTYLLRSSARSFIQKNLPSKIYSQYNLHLCRHTSI